MAKKKRISWMNLLLVFTLIVGLLCPIAKADAAKNSKKVLVVYFSATGTTKSVAKKIKKATEGKLYEIKAEDPYTEEDLDYNQDNCRANEEQQDGNVRPEIDGIVKNIEQYDTIFIG